MAILLGSLSGGMQPSAPTIGTATVLSATSASVAFTASSYIGKGTITYTATSSPGGLTGSSSSSPITVSGLTTGTAYTFTVVGTTNYGVASATTAASNSITPAASGNYYSIVSYTVPSDTSSVVTFNSIDQTYKDLVIIVRAGATYGGSGGGSGGKFYLNNDTTAKYSYGVIQGNGNGTTGGVAQGSVFTANQFDFGASWAGNANAWMSQVFIIQDYTNTSKLKAMRAISGLYCGNGTNSTTSQTAGTYNSLSAITSVQFQHPNGYSDGDLRAGSQIQIFGIKG